MDPSSLMLLARAAAPIGSRLATTWVLGRFVAFRVAWKASREARKEGIQITMRPLRRWLTSADTVSQLRERSPASMGALAIALSQILSQNDNGERAETSLRLLYIVVRSYLAAMNPAEAVALANEWQSETARRESESTRAVVLDAREAILGRFESRTSFQEGLASLPLLHTETAIRLKDTWPALENIVADLTSTTERGKILEEWASNNPSWLLECPSAVRCWLGEIAASYEVPKAAVKYFDLALLTGAYPRAYWIARLAHQQAAYDIEGATRRLEPETDSHELAAGLCSLYKNNLEEAEDHFRAWTTDATSDEPLRRVLLAVIRNARGDRNAAIAIASDAWEELQATGAALAAAGWLLERAVRGESGHRLTDCYSALDLAIRARNVRRAWFGNSAEAAALAAQAANLAGDPETAWRLTQPPPKGEATPREAADEALLSEGALTAALTGRHDLAAELASGVANAFVKAQLKAMRAEARSDGSAEDLRSVQDTWNEAWNLARTDGEHIQAAMGIANSGGSLPDLTALEVSYPDLVEELRLVGRVMSAGSDNLSQLRANVNKNRLLAVKLAERHAEDGDLELAGRTLREAGERWNDPYLMSMAARRFQEAGQLTTARDIALASLAQGGQRWAGARQMHALLIEVNSAEGRWDLASQAARTLVAMDSNDQTARWALVKCLVTRGELEEAWTALTELGAAIDPRDRDEALLWMGLSAQFSDDRRSIGRTLELMNSWPEDEELLGSFIQGLYMWLRRAEFEPTAEELASLHAATADYVQQFPNSRVFRAVGIGPDNNPLQPFEEDLRTQYEGTREIAERVRRNELPLAMLSSISGRSYTEASLHRAGGFVFALNPGSLAEEMSAVRDAYSSRAVVDPTALHSLVLLVDEVAEKLLGTPGSVITTDQLFKDTLRARDTLSLQSTMTVGWDPRTGRAVVTAISDEEAERLARRAQRLAGFAEAVARMPWPELRHFPDAPSTMTQWLSGLDLAKERGWAYWSDDAVLRSLAHQSGVASFGTVALLRVLREEGRLSSSEADLAQAEFIRNYYVEFGFSPILMERAAAADSWRPMGAAAAITRPQAWADPDAVLRFVLHALRRIAATAPDDISGWVGAASVGLVRVADTEAAASDNLAILLGDVLAQSWLGPIQFAKTLEGIRMGIDERPEVPEPLSRVLAQVHQRIVEQRNHVVAAELLMNLVSAAGDGDKALAARTVLTYKR
jgi:hypothetical protein